MQQIRRLILPVLLAAGSFGAIAEEAPLIYGFMATSDEWRDLQDQAYEQYAWYTFRADGSTPFTPISPVNQDQEWALYGGVHVDGVYYGYSVSGNWSNYYLKFQGINGTDWSTTVSNSFHYRNSQKDTEESQKAYLIPSDMAYDALNDVVYAATRRYMSDQGATLCTVNLTNGELTRIGSIPNLCALTCDPLGQLWGISIEDASLYKIGKDASYEKVGETGYYPFRDSERTQSCAYDFASGKIYWSFYGFSDPTDRNYNRNAVFAMLEVDPKTGKASHVWTYPRDQRFSAIHIMNAHPLAPADISDLAFVLDGPESSNATISLTVPSVSSSNVPLENNMTLTVVLDSELLEEKSVAPGEKYSRKVENLDNGNHTVSVTLTNGEHKGNPAYSTTFFGRDIPSRVNNLTLSAGATPTQAVLKWDAPEKGVAGFDLDQSKLRYRVVRYPGEVVVARSLNATEWTEEITSIYGPIYYIVTPYHVDAVSDLGQARRSNTFMLGTDVRIPYSEKFNNQTAFNTFTTIDVDGDGNDEWRSPCWKFDDEYYCAFYYGVRDYPANDWLITPPLQLSPDKLYKLSFHQYAYYGYGTSLRVALGDAPTVEGMTTELADLHTVTTFFDMPGRLEEIMFTPQEGQRFIGFLHYSDNMEHLSIDDISVEEIGDARVPDVPTNMMAVGEGKEKVILTLNAPETTLQKKPITEKMTVQISRTEGGEVVKEFTNVSAGQRLEWADTDCVTGLNNYYAVAINSYGRGLSAETSVDLTDAAPESVLNAYTRYINERQVEITWDPSSTDNCRYLVYRIVPGENELQYKVIGRDIDGLRYVDDAPATGYNENVQNFIQYYVAPVNGGGEGIATLSTGVFVGAPYNLPYTETWKGQAETSGPWARGNAGASWFIHGWAYEPMCDIPEGMGLLDLEANGTVGGAGYLYTPRIDLSTQTSPVLKFKMYRSNYYSNDVRVMIGVLKDGDDVIEYTSEVFRPYSSGDGAWEECSVDLSKYSDCGRASIVLAGYTLPEQRIHITDFSIIGKDDSGRVKGDYIVGNANLRVNDKETYEAFVKNNSKSDMNNVQAEILIDGAVYKTETISVVPAGERCSLKFEYAPEKTGVVEMAVRVKGASADETPATKEVNVTEYNYPIVDDLTMTSVEHEKGRKVSLQWGNAVRTTESAEDIDGFESYTKFTIKDFGAWNVYDGDGFLPFQLKSGGSILSWPYYDMPQAFIIFDPEEVGAGAPFKAQDGKQAAVSFGSPYGDNNDWLISPELSGEAQLISFFARRVNNSDKEQFNVLVSSTDNNPESFARINGNTPIKAPADWELCYFALPAGSRYFAIQYVGSKQDGIVIDDVRFNGKFSTLKADSYNVYRNGELIGTTDDCTIPFEYIESDMKSDIVYTVRPVFNGIEGVDGKEVRVNFLGIGEISASDGCTITATEGMITVCNAAHPINVYSLDGRKVIGVPASERAEISIAAGIYIVRCGEKTAKLVVK